MVSPHPVVRRSAAQVRVASGFGSGCSEKKINCRSPNSEVGIALADDDVKLAVLTQALGKMVKKGLK